MKLSIILLDWSVRESFHSIDYLNWQSSPRSSYELIWVEYFERTWPLLEKHLATGLLDKYLVLGNPPGDYHKHKAWNAGVLEASGDIVVLCDSDIMFRPSFVQSILDFFELQHNSFLLMDEIRSENKQFWPFNYPSWGEVISAPGLTNWNEDYGVTNGLAPEYNSLPLWEKLFHRNYGACLCVKKSDYIRYGGLDEHPSYTGYICGTYDLVVRLVNGGLQEHWHHTEFLLHTYHPWVKPDVDRMGPHLWYISTTSFKQLFDGQKLPYVENNQIRALRKKMFPEPSEDTQTSPKFSVLVPGACEIDSQTLYDSVKRSTKLPFEIIVVPQAEQLIYLNAGSLYHTLIEGLRTSKGEIIVIVPPQAVFRPNALDKLLDFQKKLIYPIIFLNAIETFTQGFIWQYSSNRIEIANESYRLIAFEKSLLSNQSTEPELRRIFCDGKDLSSFSETPLQLELWQNDSEIDDPTLDPLLTKMLEVQYAVTANNDNKASLNESMLIDVSDLTDAQQLLENVYAAEKETPGKFLKYCFLKRYGLKDYYNFVQLLRQLSLKQTAEIKNSLCLSWVKGCELLANNAPLLTPNINENIKELAWFTQQLAREINFFIGTAHFQLAVFNLDNCDILRAITNLNSCLKFTPGHLEAQTILHRLRSYCSS